VGVGADRTKCVSVGKKEDDKTGEIISARVKQDRRGNKKQVETE
jgi:hypothetical protein